MSWTLLRRAAIALMSAWSLALVGLGSFAYGRFMESVDFGIFAQAFTQIGSGNLDPANTLKQGSYLSSHFELIMWLLAPLSWITPGSVALVWLQALSIGACGVVVVAFGARLIEREGIAPGRGAWLVGLLCVVVASTQAFWRVNVEDFHLEPLAGLLILLAAVCLLEGRRRWMWAAVVACLLCGDVAGLYVVGLGISCLVSRRHRRAGAGLLLAGLAWMLLIGLIGANHASHLHDYSYLAGRELQPGASGLLQLGLGLVTHPLRALDVLGGRMGPIGSVLRQGGLLGILTPVGLGVPLIVLLSAGLERHVAYVEAAFQVVPAIPLLLLGTLIALRGISRWPRLGRRGGAVALSLAIALSASSLAISRSPSSWLLRGTANPVAISAAQASALAQALRSAPSDVEVIADARVVGRFAERRSVEWAFFGTTRRLPIDEGRVLLVALRPAGSPQSPTLERLRARGARLVVGRDGVEAVSFVPRPGQRSLLVEP